MAASFLKVDRRKPGQPESQPLALGHNLRMGPRPPILTDEKRIACSPRRSPRAIRTSRNPAAIPPEPWPPSGDLNRRTLSFKFPSLRLAHPRREWKPEFELEPCPPLDGASCWVLRQAHRYSSYNGAWPPRHSTAPFHDRTKSIDELISRDLSMRSQLDEALAGSSRITFCCIG